MSPTANHGDVVVVSKISYLLSEPKIGDIVMIEKGKEKMIKRIVAVGGDKVWTGGGYLYRNGELVKEPYVNELMRVGVNRVTIPKGYVYVMGDNRNHNEDSRNFGSIKIEEVKGKVINK